MMNRQELLDNLAESRRRREVVTLTLRPLTGSRGDGVKTGRVVALGIHYTGRRSPQIVLECLGEEVPWVIGLSMVKDFRVGR